MQGPCQVTVKLKPMLMLEEQYPSEGKQDTGQ